MIEHDYLIGPPVEIERLPNEPTLWFDRLVAFCQLGPTRSLLGLYRTDRASLGQNRPIHVPGAWKQACETFGWHERATKYDDQMRLLRMREQDEQRVQMNERHLKLAQYMLGQATLWLQTIEPARLKVSEGLAVMRLALELERTSRGMPPIELLDLQRMSNEELMQKYWNLLRSAAPDQPPLIVGLPCEDDLDDMLSQPQLAQPEEEPEDAPGDGSN